MPATFPSHAAAVLPLKLWCPSRFDGVALAVGSMAPDLLYALVGFGSWPETHTVAGLFWWGLPVTVVLSWGVRWAAPVIAAHLPPWPAQLALRDYGVLGSVRHPFRVTVLSALLGAASHVVWDGFTHDPAGHGWAVALLPGLRDWYVLAQYLSTVVGGLVALALAVHIGRRRLLVAWHGPAPDVARTPGTFWVSVVIGCALYPATWSILPARWSAHVQGVRMLWAVGIGLLLGTLAARLSSARRARRALGRRR
jgi:hypothetical protein